MKHYFFIKFIIKYNYIIKICRHINSEIKYNVFNLNFKKIKLSFGLL